MLRLDNPSPSVPAVHEESNMTNHSYIVPYEVCHKHYAEGNCLCLHCDFVGCYHDYQKVSSLQKEMFIDCTTNWLSTLYDMSLSFKFS